jgi:hypothetical protein
MIIILGSPSSNEVIPLYTFRGPKNNIKNLAIISSNFIGLTITKIS